MSSRVVLSVALVLPLAGLGVGHPSVSTFSAEETATIQLYAAPHSLRELLQGSERIMVGSVVDDPTIVADEQIGINLRVRDDGWLKGKSIAHGPVRREGDDASVVTVFVPTPAPSRIDKGDTLLLFLAPCDFTSKVTPVVGFGSGVFKVTASETSLLMAQNTFGNLGLWESQADIDAIANPEQVQKELAARVKTMKLTAAGEDRKMKWLMTKLNEPSRGALPLDLLVAVIRAAVPPPDLPR